MSRRHPLQPRLSSKPPPPVPPYLAISHLASPINGLSPQTSTPQVVSVKLPWSDPIVLGPAALRRLICDPQSRNTLWSGSASGALGVLRAGNRLGAQARAIRPKLVTTYPMAKRTIRHGGLRRWFVHGNASSLHPAHAERIEQILDALDDASPLEDL